MTQIDACVTYSGGPSSGWYGWGGDPTVVWYDGAGGVSYADTPPVDVTACLASIAAALGISYGVLVIELVITAGLVLTAGTTVAAIFAVLSVALAAVGITLDLNMEASLKQVCGYSE